MRDIGQSNDNIFEKYQNVTLNESKTGYRRKVQLIDDRIDNLIDDIEKKISKEDENPVYQRRLYQMLADMNKEHGEFLMSIKRIAGTIDSGAKTIPQAKGTMNPNNMQGSDEEPPAPAQAPGTVPTDQGAAPENNNVNEDVLPYFSHFIGNSTKVNIIPAKKETPLQTNLRGLAVAINSAYNRKGKINKSEIQFFATVIKEILSGLK